MKTRLQKLQELTCSQYYPAALNEELSNFMEKPIDFTTMSDPDFEQLCYIISKQYQDWLESQAGDQ